MINVDGNIKSFYLFFAILGGIFTAMMPIYYVNLGFSEVQIGFLTAVVYAAALLQPIFGYLSDSKFDPIRVVKFNLIIVMISCIGLFIFSSFQVVTLFVLLVTIFRTPLGPMADNAILSYTNRHNKDYGGFRIYASFGFGASMLLALPFMYILGFRYFLLFTFVCAFIAYLNLFKIPTIKTKKDHNYSYMRDLKKLMANKKFVLIIAFNMLFLGCCSVKLAYQSLLLQELTGDALYSSIALMISTVPEIFLMRYFAKIDAKFSYATYMIFAVILVVVQAVVFATVTNPNIILLFCLLHGCCMSIYIPGFIIKLKDSVEEEISTSAIVISSTIQCAFAFVFTMFLVTPIYANFGTEYVFVVMAVGIMLSIIPIVLLSRLERYERI